jgi:hypothetical protein
MVMNPAGLVPLDDDHMSLVTVAQDTSAQTVETATRLPNVPDVVLEGWSEEPETLDPVLIGQPTNRMTNEKRRLEHVPVEHRTAASLPFLV